MDDDLKTCWIWKYTDIITDKKIIINHQNFPVQSRENNETSKPTLWPHRATFSGFSPLLALAVDRRRGRTHRALRWRKPSHPQNSSENLETMASVVLKSLSILLGIFFIFVGTTKISPTISKELHKDLVRHPPFPIDRWQCSAKSSVNIFQMWQLNVKTLSFYHYCQMKRSIALLSENGKLKARFDLMQIPDSLNANRLWLIRTRQVSFRFCCVSV